MDRWYRKKRLFENNILHFILITVFVTDLRFFQTNSKPSQILLILVNFMFTFNICNDDTTYDIFLANFPVEK